MCEYCDDTGEIETANNGPIGPCTLCSSSRSQAGYGVRPVYKMVKEHRPHCPRCGDRLTGNNSYAMPYKCSCGVWRPDPQNPVAFDIDAPYPE